MKLNRAQLLALNLDSHIVVNAGAGTGKTSTIIDRVLEHYLSEDQRATRILPKPERPFELSGGLFVSGKSEIQNLQEWNGLLPSEVVLLTFTNKAADEMKDRLRVKLTNLTRGPSGYDGQIRKDPRIRFEGFNEQLLTLLDDAPIGTIDSFFNQLISPYRGILGESLTQDYISDSSRILLTESALNILWRLSSHPSQFSVAIDAGIPNNLYFGPKEVLDSRDRLQTIYAGRERTINVIRSICNRSIFINEAIKGLTDSSGRIVPEKLKNRLFQTINSNNLDNFVEQTQEIISRFCNEIKEFPNIVGTGWSPESRIACLNHIASSSPGRDIWEKLVWLSNVYYCVVTRKSLLNSSRSPSILPYYNLPNDDKWLRGIDKLGKAGSSIKPISKEFRKLWYSEIGEKIQHFIRLTILLNDENPPCTPIEWEKPFTVINGEIPHKHPKNDNFYAFSLEKESKNLDDLRIVMQGLNGILEKLKQLHEVHDFTDVQKMAGDLLLANCPKFCENFYPEIVIKTLNNPSEDTWKDDHIISALSILETFERDSLHLGNPTSDILECRRDLERRYDLLKRIRRRYRAFIIDEAQDNSPLQWRLLSRLWGPRHFEEDEKSIPDTPWQPTICYVGDIKQSIYAFRQAEVTGFKEYSEKLRQINNHEFSSIPELTVPGRELRSEDLSRNPRNSHEYTISSARTNLENGGQELHGWIPFHHYDGLDVGSQKETNLRKEGEISLKINYRTDGGLLEVMNEWWEDIFHSRHRRIFDGKFYADSQKLFSSEEKSNLSGKIEWICPTDNDLYTDPSVDNNEYLDPFVHGKSLERQGMMIAKRIKHLIDGKSVRVRSSDGRWDIQSTSEKVSPDEIMILLPSRRDIRDIIVRYLNDYDIPFQVDREGGLLDRAVIHTLNGLLQFIARPQSRHHATWVARSCLIGFNDKQIQDFIGPAKNNENLLLRLEKLTINSRQKELVSRWIKLSSKGLIIELLENTIDFSDLLLTYSDQTSLEDTEHFIDLITSLSSELGGDAIIIADRIRQLKELDSSALEAVTTPVKNAVRIMSIHASKGLQASVVFLVDIFSKRQTNLSSDSRSRVMVSPELFSGNPIPWTNEQKFKSVTWMHTRWLVENRKDAEARRLIYVAATRTKERLIIVGSPKGTSWKEGSGLIIPWFYSQPMPRLGQIWLESLRNGSFRRSENSVWAFPDKDPSQIPEKNYDRIIDPFLMVSNSSLGSDKLHGMIVLHDLDCFNDIDDKDVQEINTPSQKLISIHELVKSQNKHVNDRISPRLESSFTVKTAPHRLSILSECSRRHWFETRGGLTSNPIVPLSGKLSSKQLDKMFDAALFGSVIHRIVEIGIPNPGKLSDSSPSLPSSWSKKNSNGLINPEIHKKIYDELLDKASFASEMDNFVIEMTNRLSDSRLGRLVSGETIDGEIVEGLRTELPFNISFKVQLDGLYRGRWTPSGKEDITLIKEASVQMDGLIDIVLCTDGKTGPSIRPIDLKTEEASKLFTDSLDGLLESLGEEKFQPSCDAEFSMLYHHRMQLALYYRALEKMESMKSRPRKVLRPAIWVGVTGRLVEYPEELFSQAQEELEDLLREIVLMELNSEGNLSDYPPLTLEKSKPCDSCPFSKGLMPICGPEKQEL